MTKSATTSPKSSVSSTKSITKAKAIKTKTSATTCYKPSKKLVDRIVCETPEEEGQFVYNLLLNDHDNNDKLLWFQYGLKRRFYELDTNAWRLLKRHYNKFHNVSTYDSMQHNYGSLLRVVGQEWVKKNLPDEIDLGWSQVSVADGVNNEESESEYEDDEEWLQAQQDNKGQDDE